MMTERMKTAIERTEKKLCRHLEDLNDQIDANGGRISDHMALDGIKDSLKSVRYCYELMAMAGNGDAAKSAAIVAK